MTTYAFGFVVLCDGTGLGVVDLESVRESDGIVVVSLNESFSRNIVNHILLGRADHDAATNSA